MTIRQRIGLVIFCLVISLLISSCGRKAPPPEEPTPTPTITETPESTTDTPDPTRTKRPTDDDDAAECANETYTVVDGDTLSDIASRYGLPLGSVIAANQAEDPNFNMSTIYVGQRIVIPACEVPNVTIAPPSGGQPAGGGQPQQPSGDQPFATLGS